ncbi:MAG: phenylacetate--CoA ligase family protein, partial [Bacteroidetes bacterium]|nr:phenylacetate--CoA ligase family protein [Bacteroidota bacterium]
LEELQAERLRKLIAHATTTVPYYRRIFVEYGIPPSQIQTPHDLKRLPTLSKDTLRREGTSMMAETYRKRHLQRESTSGTSGTPLPVLMNREAYIYAKAAQWLHHEWAGYTHREWIGILAGYNVIGVSREAPPFWTTNYAGHQMHFSTRHLKPRFFPFFVQKLRSSGIQFLFGYPSAIALLARHIVSTDDHLPLRAVFLSSEPLYEWQAEAIRTAFGCPVFNYYGQAEKALTATGCGTSLDMHTNMELSVAEFIPDEKIGDKVRVLGTSLLNFGMPLIRYELHDITTLRDTPCPCGREHVRIGPVETHSDDYIVASDGSLISPSLLYFPFQEATGLDSSQVVQDEINRVTVKIVPNERFTNEEGESLCSEVAGIVGRGTLVTIERVTEIPLTANGKFRFVVSNISRDVLRNENVTGTP